jgi:hypothetical protein
MRQVTFLLTLICSITVVTVKSFSQVPSLPDGAQTHWIVDQPKEIVSWILFNPSTVENRLPSTLQFITVGELASTGIPWAVDYLSENPKKKTWGISFLEIVKTGTFTIDKVALEWPEKGAAALWFARVAPVNPQEDFGYGQAYLALDFWIPDSSFAVKMRKKGHYATFGNVTLYQDEYGWWQGVIDMDDLKVVGNCLPTEPIYGGAQSTGKQTIFPPKESGVTDVVLIAFAGHRIQYCKDSSTWSINGSHPLSNGVLLEPFEFQFGYDMIGGAYQR